MNPEETLAWQGNIHFYNALSEFYLHQDLYSLSSMMQSMLETQYGERAKQIIEYIHSDEHKLITDSEVKILKDEEPFLERDYSHADPAQTFVYYKNCGYEIENLEADHLGVELKFLAILALETLEKEDIVSNGPKELRYINNRFEWLHALYNKLQDDPRDLRLSKEVVSLTIDYLHAHNKFLTRLLRLEYRSDKE